MAVAVVVVAAGCSSGGDDGSTPATTVVATAAPRARRSRTARPVPTVQGPVTGGKGAVVLGPGGFDLATVGYQQEEYFISGDATAYVADGAAGERRAVDRLEGQPPRPYTTRVVVRRPIDAADFDGTVFVEWLNVSGGLDASPDWTYAHVELIRSGAAWVGVSAQQVGIVGGGNAVGAALALKNADPERYAALVASGRRLLLRHVQPGRRRGVGRARRSCSATWSPSGCWPSASRSRRSGSRPT